MLKLKSIKLYFFSIIKLSFLILKKNYYKGSYYNKKLVTFIPSRIFYNPSTYLTASLTSLSYDFYKITNTSPEILWKTKTNEKLKFENLHSFLWLTKLDRKNSKNIIKEIISSWINNFFNYEPNTWGMEITAKRIIAWASNTDLILKDSDKNYKERFYISLIKQSNFLLKNINSLFYNSTKIICCSAIILSGIIFKENQQNYKIGIRELEKTIKNYFDENGFPKSRNPEEVFICIRYLILIREWLIESQEPVPEFLNDSIKKSGECYSLLSCSNKQFPLFNGATEINHKDFDTFLKTLKYKFNNKKHEISDLIKIKKKKFEFFIDCGNPPPNFFSQHYQAGCLSFELITNKQKIICNSGYAKYFSPKLAFLSRATAAHSTLYLNDTSSCIFQKNKVINSMYGNCLIGQHKIINKSYSEDKDFYTINASHNGYEKKFGYIHERFIKIYKKIDKILGQDQLKKTKNHSVFPIYSVRFHVYPNTKIVKTKGGNSILISLSNGEGWLLESKTNDLEIEKNVFLGNKYKIINSESILISGAASEKITSIEWTIERAT